MKTKRILAWVLSVMMIFTMLPGISLTAFAADGDEAMWGTSASSLTESGTLADAITAAAEDSTVKYVQLQSDVESDFEIGSGEFTIDLNGNDVSSDVYTFDIRNSGTKITFVDSADTDSADDNVGTVSTTGSGFSAVSVDFGASVTINGGVYEGAYAAIYVWDSSSSATIQSGTFTSTQNSTVYNIYNEGTLLIEGGSFNSGSVSAVCTGSSSVSTTITGGTFTAGDYGTIVYFGGKLDLSGHSDPTGISISNWTSAAVTPSADTIKLPEGYCFYDSNNTAVSSLAAGKTYTIGAAQTGGEAAYTVTVNLSNDGTVEADKESAAAGETVTLTVTPRRKLFDRHHFLQRR